MARLAGGDQEALVPLVERHYRRLYRLSLSYLRQPDDALDTVQEVFVKAVEHAPRWDGSSDAGPWLTRVTVNLSIDRYRRTRRRNQTFAPLVNDGRLPEAAVGDPSPEQHAHGRLIGARISRALLALPERQRAVFVLRHYEDMSLEEIARLLSMNLGTVKSSLHRALLGLRERLGGLRT
jgi:RNA polymerase sigma-70 factor (ECF subfamily)